MIFLRTDWPNFVHNVKLLIAWADLLLQLCSVSIPAVIKIIYWSAVPLKNICWNGVLLRSSITTPLIISRFTQKFRQMYLRNGIFRKFKDEVFVAENTAVFSTEFSDLYSAI